MVSTIAALVFGGKWKIYDPISFKTSFPSFLKILKIIYFYFFYTRDYK